MKQKNINGIKTEDMNPKIRPQDDFFHHACGKWIKNNPIPKTETKWGSFRILRDNTRKQIEKIFKELKKNKELKLGSTAQLLRDFYLSGMNEKKIEKLGLTPLAPEMEMIGNINSVDTLRHTLAHLHTLGINALWSPFVTLDDKNSEKMSLFIRQGSLGLPEREYYLSEESKFIDIRKKYLQHIKKMLEFSGVNKKEVKTAVAEILVLETGLAKASMTPVERRNPEKIYNKMSLKELQLLVTIIDWKKYFSSLAVTKPGSVIVGQVKYMRHLNTLLKKTPNTTWQYYLKFRLISTSADLLPNIFVEERFKFRDKILLGLKEMKPRWQQVYGVIDAGLADAIGEEYVARHFSDNAKNIMDDLVLDITGVYKERIQQLDWMSNTTKKKALQKLAACGSKIGYPKNKRDYTGLVIKEGTYLRNFFNTIQFESARELAKLNQPIDRDEWFIGAHIVNAFYWPNQNEIVFPAGILQPPFFDETGDPALNYGAIGSVIGHELTHGFDDEGSQFDYKGNLKNWWTPADRKAFTKKTKLIEKQYNDFKVVDELFVNGKLTLGENIADLGGVVLAYNALQKHMEHHGRLPDINGYSPEQRFFFGLVLFERESTLKETARLLAICDPHAPAYTRVNGPFTNFTPFYEAFDVKKGDGMYREPKNRVDIW